MLIISNGMYAKIYLLAQFNKRIIKIFCAVSDFATAILYETQCDTKVTEKIKKIYYSKTSECGTIKFFTLMLRKIREGAKHDLLAENSYNKVWLLKNVLSLNNNIN